MSSLAAPLYVVTGVLAVAGFAKLRTPSPTATALRALRVPRPLVAARVLGAVEVAIAVAAVVTASAVLWFAVAAAYAGFTAFILWALSGNEGVASCGCFGHDDTPPTPGHMVFNAVATTLAAFAVADPVALGDFDGTAIEAIVGIVLVGIGIALSVGALAHLPRTLALAHGTAAPSVATFSLSPQGSPSPQGSK